MQNIKHYIKFLIFCIFLILQNQVFAQKNYKLEVSSDNETLAKYRFLNKHQDSISALNEVQSLIKVLKNDGFLLTQIDTLTYKENRLSAKINLGKRFFWKKLNTDSLSTTLINSIGLKPKYFRKRPFSYKQVEDLKEDILTYSENNGFPFAAVKLENINLDNQYFSARLNYKAGQEMTFDTLIVDGTAKINKDFLLRFLKIKKGTRFNQSLVNKSSRLLKQLPYLRIKRKPSVIFDSKRAFVKLYLDKKPANQLDAIIGFLPNENTSSQNPNSQILITGDINLKLKNLFSSGKNLGFQWQRLQVETSSLNLEYENPQVFKTNFDFSIYFDLLRQDSSFVNVDRRLSIFYNLSNAGRLSLDLDYRTSRLGQATEFSTATELPDFSSTNYFSYGIGYTWNNLDDFFYPKHGKNLSFKFAFGNKNIEQNPLLADSLYDGLALKTSQILIEGLYEQFLQLSPRTTFLVRLRAAAIFNENLFLNDLYRLGGLNSLRGHNENLFFASRYGITTVEYRIFIEEESYFFAFYDQAYYQRQVQNDFSEEFPFGLGVGVSFKVRLGIFNLVYALGQSEEQNLAFNRSKIHFGLISRF